MVWKGGRDEEENEKGAGRKTEGDEKSRQKGGCIIKTTDHSKGDWPRT